MAIRKCYRLWVIDAFISELPPEQNRAMCDIDEDYTNKKDWLARAKKYTKAFNEKFNTNYKYQDFFGEVDDIGDWRYCTICGESFWADQEHECEDY